MINTIIEINVCSIENTKQSVYTNCCVTFSMDQ